MNEEFLINSYLKKLSKNNPSSLDLNDDVFFDKNKKYYSALEFESMNVFVRVGYHTHMVYYEKE